jgi:hypothetical protein
MSGSDPAGRVLRGVVAHEGGRHRVFDDDGPAGRALLVLGQVTAADDDRGGVAGVDGDRVAARAAVDCSLCRVV